MPILRAHDEKTSLTWSVQVRLLRYYRPPHSTQVNKLNSTLLEEEGRWEESKESSRNNLKEEQNRIRIIFRSGRLLTHKHLERVRRSNGLVRLLQNKDIPRHLGGAQRLRGSEQVRGFKGQRKKESGNRKIKAGPPLDLSFWSFLTFLHYGIEQVKRHLLWKFYKKIRRKSWSNVRPKLVACIGFLYKVVHKIGRLRKFNRSRGI